MKAFDELLNERTVLALGVATTLRHCADRRMPIESETVIALINRAKEFDAHSAQLIVRAATTGVISANSETDAIEYLKVLRKMAQINTSGLVERWVMRP